MSNLILFNKPFNVLCQFSGEDENETLKHFIHDPSLNDFYPAGRLDKDSEGLLLLTNDGKIQNLISDPKHKWEKTYWVQVEGLISDEAISRLRDGVELKDGMTRPAKVTLIDEPVIWERVPPIRKRLHIPTSWLELKITEGRNRQVRRMTAATGFPTLRLIRYAVGAYTLKEIQPGQFKLCKFNSKEK